MLTSKCTSTSNKIISILRNYKDMKPYEVVQSVLVIYPTEKMENVVNTLVQMVSKQKIIVVKGVVCITQNIKQKK